MASDTPQTAPTSDLAEVLARRLYARNQGGLRADMRLSWFDANEAMRALWRDSAQRMIDDVRNAEAEVATDA